MRREIGNAIAVAVGMVTLVVIGPWLINQLRSLPPPAHLSARSDQRAVTLEVGGMTCRGCETAVRAQLQAVPGVADVAVRHRQSRAYVVCDKGLADSVLVAAVKRAGPGFVGMVVQK